MTLDTSRLNGSNRNDLSAQISNILRTLGQKVNDDSLVETAYDPTLSASEKLSSAVQKYRPIIDMALKNYEEETVTQARQYGAYFQNLTSREIEEYILFAQIQTRLQHGMSLPSLIGETVTPSVEPESDTFTVHQLLAQMSREEHQHFATLLYNIMPSSYLSVAHDVYGTQTPDELADEAYSKLQQNSSETYAKIFQAFGEENAKAKREVLFSMTQKMNDQNLGQFCQNLQHYIGPDELEEVTRNAFSFSRKLLDSLDAPRDLLDAPETQRFANSLGYLSDALEESFRDAGIVPDDRAVEELKSVEKRRKRALENAQPQPGL